MRAFGISDPLAIFWSPTEEGSAATICRLMMSRHVADLRFIARLTVISFAIAACVAIPFEYWHLLSDNWKADVGQAHSRWIWLRMLGDAVVGGSPFIGAAFALACGIIGWAYQAGSARLGIVDLFACEICTLCRVYTVSDLTRSYVDSYKADLDDATADPARVKRIRDEFRMFDARENYTPVFDGHAIELKALDVKVVTHVTAFYTYAKAMRDALRKLASIDDLGASPKAHNPWHEALANVLYMQFLALESARKAVRDLIEFEPNEAENTITILVSELAAYGLLLEHFGRVDRGAVAGDFRYARLALRKDEYKRTVAWAYCRAEDGDTIWKRREGKLRGQPLLSPAARAKADTIADVARQWGRTRETANELRRRFSDLFPGAAIERPPALPKPDPECLMA